MIVVLLVMQFIAAIVFGYYLLTVNGAIPTPPLSVLRLENPQHIINKQLKQTELLKVTASKCNLTNEPVAVDGVSYLVQEAPNYQRYLRTQATGVTRLPGCMTINYANDLRIGIPTDVTLEPGIYHLEGAETVRIGDRVQTAPWYTESFEIIE